MDKKYTFAIHTLGCKVNTYESDLLCQELIKAGFVNVPFTGQADVYIINTCTVTNIADRKSRQMLHRVRKLSPGSLIVAAGCYADAGSQGKAIEDADVDLWVKNSEKNLLPGLLKEKLGIGNNESCPAGTWDAPFLTELKDHTRAFVKIEDGCNMFCTYCIIPYVRGKVTARPVEDTYNEVKGLSEKGVKEVVLTGIHLSSMGRELLRTIEAVNSIEGIERIRLGSLEPRLITKAFAAELKKYGKLCPHFHLSLQSGCDRVLKAMNRRYTCEDFKEGVAALREVYPDAAITTDVIAGFPGETSEDHEKTKAFMKDINFYEAHVFKYSRRKGTAADLMKDQLTEQVKAARSAELIKISEEESHAFRERFIGRTLSFLCEEETVFEGNKYITGFTREYVRCLCPFEGDPLSVQGKIVTGRAQKLIKTAEGTECLLLV